MVVVSMAARETVSMVPGSTTKPVWIFSVTNSMVSPWQRDIVRVARIPTSGHVKKEEPYFFLLFHCTPVGPTLPTAPVSRSFGLRSSYESVLLTPNKDPNKSLRPKRGKEAIMYFGLGFTW
jgi:hypothetical protein